MDCSPWRIRVLRLAHAGRAERVGRPRPAQLRLRTLGALHERRGRPLRMEGWRRELPVDGLQDRPCEPGAVGCSCLDRSPHVHPIRSPRQELARHADAECCPRQLRKHRRTIAHRSRPSNPGASRTNASSFARSVLPRSVSGIRSSKTIVRGTLWAARRAAQNCRISGAVTPWRAGDHDTGHDLLTAHGVGDAQHAHILDSAHRAQHLLDLLRLDFLSRDVDERRCAAGEDQAAAGRQSARNRRSGTLRP